MEALHLPEVDSIRPHNTWSIFLSLAGFYVAFRLASTIHDVYFGPLSKIPGPKSRAFSKIPSVLTELYGTESTDVPALHAKYGPIVRVAPGDVSYAGGKQAWKDIDGFQKHGGHLRPVKDDFFYDRSFNGVHSLITADDANHARQRKILTNSFADKSLRELEPMLKDWVAKLWEKLREKDGESIDILKYYNCTTFGKSAMPKSSPQRPGTNRNLDIMGDLSFNENLGMLDSGEYSSWVKTIFDSIKTRATLRAFRSLSPLANWAIRKFVLGNPKAVQKIAEHWNYSKERVDRRLSREPGRPDLWTKILQKSSGPEGLSTGEHHATASVFMIAGTETTGMTSRIISQDIHQLTTLSQPPPSPA
jgi:hypothetical protein